LLGGDITVRSTAGKGSTFTLSISTDERSNGKLIWSIGDRPRSKSPVLAGIATHKLHGRVLLVEDGVDNQEFLSFILRHAGVASEICENGAAALHLVQKAEFDLILMDMQMPVMDGYTATRLLRERGFAKPIVALTANTVKQELERAISSGCDDCLGKPFSTAEFTDMLRKFLKSEPLAGRCAETHPLLGMRRLIDEQPEIAVLAKGFLSRLPLRMTALADAFEQGDFSTLASLAHQLRGAAGGYGLSQVSDLAAALERAVPSGNPEQIEAILKEIKDNISTATAHAVKLDVLEQ
jgi:CheY-like chemotaxis protein